MSTLKVTSPFDGSPVGELPLVGEAEIAKMYDKAHALFKDQSKWLPAHERIAILERAVELMKERKDDLVKTAASEGGKPWNDTVVEVNRAMSGTKLAAEYIGHIAGEEIPLGMTPPSVNRRAFTMREPIGVVVSVSAFNHPLNLIVHQTAPAIAVGCPVLIKPASSTPLSCVKYVEILHDAGLPKDWCQAVICRGADAEKMVTDPRTAFFSFIGSGKVGWGLRSKLAPGARCALEHGGVAPVIVEPDADLDSMLPLLAKGGFYHAGQVCVSVQRVYVHNSICDQVANGLAALADKMVVGDPLSDKTEIGPLIDPKEVDRVEEWVNEAREKGAEILCGGERISDTCYKATVILNPPEDALVSTKEVFGPVVCVYSYEDREQAIARANSLEVAFQASVFTKDLDTALDTVRKLNATAVMVNDHTAFRVDWMPFGGRDASGMGMGGIPYSMHEMTREKMMVIKSKAL